MEFIYSRWLRWSAARGSSTRSFLVGPTYITACKLFLFTEKFPCSENKEHLIDFLITFFSSPWLWLGNMFHIRWCFKVSTPKQKSVKLSFTQAEIWTGPLGLKHVSYQSATQLRCTNYIIKTKGMKKFWHSHFKRFSSLVVAQRPSQTLQGELCCTNFIQTKEGSLKCCFIYWVPLSVNVPKQLKLAQIVQPFSTVG